MGFHKSLPAIDGVSVTYQQSGDGDIIRIPTRPDSAADWERMNETIQKRVKKMNKLLKKDVRVNVQVEPKGASADGETVKQPSRESRKERKQRVRMEKIRKRVDREPRVRPRRRTRRNLSLLEGIIFVALWTFITACAILAITIAVVLILM